MTGEDEERNKEIEKLVEERVESLRQDLEEKNQEIKGIRKEVEQLKSQSNIPTANTGSSNKRISRRQFLKKAGLGTAGLSALLAPVSADYFIKDDSFDVQTGTGPNDLSTYFSVGQGGPVNIQNTHLDLNNQGIRNVGSLELPRSEASNDHRIWLDTSQEKLKVKIGGKLYLSEIRPAIPDTVVDQFESTTDVTTHYSGDTGSFAINNNSPVFEGTNSLKHGVSVTNVEIFSSQGDGLNYYPERGDWVQGQVRAETSGCRTGPILFASGSGTGYSFEIATNGNEFRIRDVKESSTLKTGGSPTVGQTYTINVYSNSTEIKAEWVDQSDDTIAASLSVTDSNNTGRGFGHKERDTGVSDDYRAKKGHGLP